MKSFSNKVFLFIGTIIIIISAYVCFRIPVSFGVSFAMAIITIVTGGIIVASEIYSKNSIKNHETNEIDDNIKTDKIGYLAQPEEGKGSFYDDEGIEEDLEELLPPSEPY
ncbi:hypothetical protein [Clostridium lundense]|uniref:hypothetical protein n=1 Tax=Clostridium lundense TaxID=319475 RepID=UPI0004828B21|nr:hypothetical protein [Clostridium lundense]